MLIAMVSVFGMGCVGWADGAVKLKTFNGCCDASAGVALDAHSFVVGDDESNVLRVYAVKGGPEPTQVVDLKAFLNLEGKKPETDIEAAAMVGNRVYWITSHGLNRVGKDRENRHRFFATQVDRSTNSISIVPVGKPYESLQGDMLRAPGLAGLGLAKAARISPKVEGGFNIEGLGAGPGGRLWIGLRGPMSEGKAILIPLINPEQVVDNGTAAVFGEARLLDLGGLAVRDMVWRDGAMYILAGPTLQGQPYRVFRWNPEGTKVVPMGEVIETRGHPEVLMAFPDAPAHKFYVLLDDGSREIGGVRCKDLPEASRHFRGGVLRLFE